MAFPTRSTPLWTKAAAVSRAFAANLPGTIEAGDLLVCVAGMHDGPLDGVWPSSPTDSTADAWTSLIGNASNVNRTGRAWYKIADGDEDSGTLTLDYTNGNASAECEAWVIRIPAAEWHGTTPPEATSWAARTNDISPAIPSLNPSGWGTEDTLWIAALISNQDMSGITGPSGYDFNSTQGQDWDANGVGALVPQMAIASIETAAASEGGQDWGAATNWDGTVDHLAAMIAVRPAATAPSNWTLVGETSGSLAADATASPTLPGSPAEDDVVLVVVGSDSGVGTSLGTGIDSGQGYTYVLNEDLTEDACQAAIKVMGVTPDTTVNLTAPVSPSTRRMAYAIQVWRGADPSTPQDATRTLAENTVSGYPDSPSITTVTDQALVIAFGLLDDIDEEGLVAAPSGYTNLIAKDTDEPTNPTTDGATVMIASKEVATAGAENPAAFSGSGSSSWEAGTLALRPATDTGGASLLDSSLLKSPLTHSRLIR